jgi:hypothetical protein
MYGKPKKTIYPKFVNFEVKMYPLPLKYDGI